MSNLISRFSSGDRRALAEILTLVESGTPPPKPTIERSAKTHVVGITGSGGAGKGTLIAALLELLRKKNIKVAVLACDPQSPVTGGALLGDRIRVHFDPADEGVYFRSLSTRGAQGGVSAAVGPAIEWLKAFGFDVVIVETVGVGQDQVAVRPLVETLVMLVTPHSGDEVQWEKAGLIEVADLIVVNKSDLPGADRVRQQLLGALTLATGKSVPVLNVTASNGAGVAELWDAILSHSAV